MRAPGCGRRERRRQRVRGTDSLAAESFRALEVRPGLAYEAGAVRATGSLEYRTEDGVAAGDFQEATRTWTAQTELGYTPAGPYQVSVQGGVRSRRVTDFFRRTEQLRAT